MDIAQRQLTEIDRRIHAFLNSLARVAARIIRRRAFDHVDTAQPRKCPEAVAPGLEAVMVACPQRIIRGLDRERAAAGGDSIASRRRQLGFYRIEKMREIQLAVAGKAAQVLFRLGRQLAEVAEQKDQAPGPRNPREPKQRVLGVDLTGRSLRRSPKGIGRDPLEQPQRRTQA